MWKCDHSLSFLFLAKTIKNHIMEKEKCPNCKIELEHTNVSDAYSGDVILTASCSYCPKCLYVTDEYIRLSK